MATDDHIYRLMVRKATVQQQVPIILAVRPNCTIEEVVWKYSDIAGKVGRYISVTNGPNAVSIPKNTSINTFEFFLPFILLYFLPLQK